MSRTLRIFLFLGGCLSLAFLTDAMVRLNEDETESIWIYVGFVYLILLISWLLIKLSVGDFDKYFKK